ncbi:MAG: sorbosone dehydrogenase family protein [Puniceicoccaceae bacterium]
MGGASLAAQDYFPSPIPDSGIALQVVEVATVPDSSPGQPPRMSVLTGDPSGRLFVNDQRGPLYIVDEKTGAVTEYLDLRDYSSLAILSTSEAGFQSFAFHPDFYNSGEDGFGRFYTIHSSNNTSSPPDFNPGGSTVFHTLLIEWTTVDPSADTFMAANAEEPYRILIRFKQPFGNHNAGLIAFNPAVPPGNPGYGNLYIAMGDGGAGGDPQDNGQDTSNPYGAILRIDPLGTNSGNGQYGLVAENAFAADTDPGTLPEIYSFGLRNPQRFGWDAVTGNLFIADIGQNAVEEINLGSNGTNFGWNVREGSFNYSGAATPAMVNPVAEYDHTQTVSSPPTGIGNRAVTTGEVVRGACIPELEGMLPLGDFPTGLIFLLPVDTDPLDGGQDGLSELYLLDNDSQKVRLLDLINAARANRGLSASSRADLRFSINTPGRLYITNKHDGIIRAVLPTSSPAVTISKNEEARFVIHYEGVLQKSNDLQNWDRLVPQPQNPWLLQGDDLPVFLRASCPEPR